MGLTSNASELSALMERRAEMYAAEIRRSQLENASLIMEKARELSSQRRLSTLQQQMMGNPYASAHPHPPLPPYIINDQGGSFSKSWVVEEQDGPDGPTATVTNTAPHAKYMRGTSRMIPRPVLDEAIRETAQQRRLNLDAHRRRAMSAR